mmetsp:Transcript_1482/g.3862  ORF Transcript_1482/g.3862 Transcript_1482/m.3862 type:complete len:278 (-) Transcript_1482:132-965(-)
MVCVTFAPRRCRSGMTMSSCSSDSPPLFSAPAETVASKPRASDVVSERSRDGGMGSGRLGECLVLAFCVTPMRRDRLLSDEVSEMLRPRPTPSVGVAPNVTLRGVDVSGGVSEAKATGPGAEVPTAVGAVVGAIRPSSGSGDSEADDAAELTSRIRRSHFRVVSLCTNSSTAQCFLSRSIRAPEIMSWRHRRCASSGVVTCPFLTICLHSSFEVQCRRCDSPRELDRIRKNDGVDLPSFFPVRSLTTAVSVASRSCPVEMDTMVDVLSSFSIGIFAK